MSDEWTDWRDHDGKGVPAELKVGMVINAELFDFEEMQTEGLHVFQFGVPCQHERWEETAVDADKSWISPCDPEYLFVIRYRIRKPHSLQQLIKMVETLPVPVKNLEITE